MAVNKALAFVIGLCCAMPLLAQDAVFLQRADSTSILDSAAAQISIHGNYNFDSNSLYNDLTNGLRYARVISRATRDRSRDALKAKNRIGSEIEVAATCRHFSDSMLGKGTLGWQIALSHNEVLGVKFTRDLYNLTFYGNKAYEDSTARLDDSNQSEYKYQKIGFGLFNKHSLSSATLSLVKGQRYVMNDIRRASLYTAPEGLYLDLNLDGTLESSDSSETDIWSLNGWGAALDFELNVPLTINGRPNHFSQLSLSVQDLGFVFWNGESTRATPDTTFRFEGITVDNLLNLDDAIVAEDDILDSLGVHIEKEGYMRMLPVNIRLSLRSRFHHRWFAEAGVRYRDIRAFVPHAWLNISYLPREQFRISLLNGYGGFGGYRIGIGTEVMFAEKWYLMARTFNLVGSITESARGQQVEVGISAMF